MGMVMVRFKRLELREGGRKVERIGELELELELELCAGTKMQFAVCQRHDIALQTLQSWIT